MNILTSNRIVVFSLLLSFLSASLFADDSSIGELFEKYNVTGTIIISSLDGKKEYIYNEKRAEKRYLPASTFKIPNSLIFLDEGVIKDEKEVIKWDGKDRGWKNWNKDQTMESALPYSCVWFYQELAKKVGAEKYPKHLEKLSYGNQLTGDDVSTFWLEGDIKISAREQINFLKKFYQEKLPYKKEHLKLVKKLLVIQETEDYKVSGKTGWALRLQNQHGWFVGYVEKNDEVWFFAMNMDIKNKSDAAYRVKITEEALQLKGIL